MDNSKMPLLGMSLNELKQVASECGLRPFAARQIAQWLYKKRVSAIDQMTDISLAGRSKLAENYVVGLQEPLSSVASADGTVKYLFPGTGGVDVESVFIPDRDRATLCVSSQAGCKMRCAFCMTGRQGFHGNLTSHQIINQILSVADSDALTNIVFMGMGEPLDNMPELLKALDILTSDWGFAWSPKRITVSTIGKLDTLEQLLTQTKVHVAVSVHNPFADERGELMPVERAFPLRDIFARLRQFDWTKQRRLSVEYTMFRGVNDSPRHADALARMLRGMGVRVNLIRFHQIPDSPLRPCDEQHMVAFRDRLNAAGITATIRASRGEDIMAACGMLAGDRASKS